MDVHPVPGRVQGGEGHLVPHCQDPRWKAAQNILKCAWRRETDISFSTPLNISLQKNYFYAVNMVLY